MVAFGLQVAKRRGDEDADGSPSSRRPLRRGWISAGRLHHPRGSSNLLSAHSLSHDRDQVSSISFNSGMTSTALLIPFRLISGAYPFDENRYHFFAIMLQLKFGFSMLRSFARVLRRRAALVTEKCLIASSNHYTQDYNCSWIVGAIRDTNAHRRSLS